MKQSKQHLKDVFKLNHLLSGLFSLLLMAMIILPQNLLAQAEANDENKILELCLTFQPLEEKIPFEVNEQISEYSILDHGIEFNFSPTFEVNGKRVFWISKGELNQINLYFDFFTFNIQDNKFNSAYYVNYSIDDIQYTISVDIELIKNNSLWEVTNYSIK